MAKERSWFAPGEIPLALHQSKALNTRDLAAIVQDSSTDLTSTCNLLHHHYGKEAVWEQLDIRLQVQSEA